jgi:NAD(P)-dependent dehydrogenase (short-subunit alcohol dehydrogenase family)
MSRVDGQPRRIVVLGGNSEIAIAALRALRPHDVDEIVLAGRSREALEAVAATLHQRTSLRHFEALDWPGHQTLMRTLFTEGSVDVVLLAFGILGEQHRAEGDPAHALEIIDVDFRAQVSLLLHAVREMRLQGHGVLVVFSSIAGVRARRANFVYGAAKAGLDAFASGLADSLHGTGIRLVVVRPGFVIGRMTAGMRPAPFAVTPDRVGRSVASALQGDIEVVWVPPRLRLIAAVMRLVPRAWWRRLRR